MDPLHYLAWKYESTYGHADTHMKRLYILQIPSRPRPADPPLVSLSIIRRSTSPARGCAPRRVDWSPPTTRPVRRRSNREPATAVMGKIGNFFAKIIRFRDGPTASAGSAESPFTAVVIALLTYDTAVMIGILAESKDTIAGWNTATEVAYLAMVVVTCALTGVGFMAGTGCPAAAAATTKRLVGEPSFVSPFCARLGAILASALLVVTISCKFEPWGCTAGVPSAAVVACVMAAVWVWAEPEAREAVCRCWSRVRGLGISQTK
ncbi:uncharacterized protein [Setaria viridis]|uniref:Uncharacterized protein n=1 Tax=Setaria viridis TaxID=4556 RepID=A0A4U6VPY6_SETVI|nr:uncharacterized protein LOC117845900 [Setaria viridis]TKW30814.1 hypothetical protein SEVIR_2G062700v2 [Setaria viridis]